LGDHLAQMIRIQEVSGKIGQGGNVPAVDIGPEKGLLERLVTVIGVYFVFTPLLMTKICTYWNRPLLTQKECRW